MIELPEAICLSNQINEHLKGKKIAKVIANASPHKFVWISGEQEDYEKGLIDQKIKGALSYGGIVEIQLEKGSIYLSDGINLRYGQQGDEPPKKHQMFFEFGDDSFLSMSAQMYGGILCDIIAPVESNYMTVAKEKPSPLTDAFTFEYFDEMFSQASMRKKSLKAFLATEQRIPGLGNGVLQDILLNAELHPKRKVMSLESDEVKKLYDSVVSTLHSMTEQGMRSTEKDIFGRPGGYQVLLSKDTYKSPCLKCGGQIVKKAYMGGSIYYCESCQPEG